MFHRRKIDLRHIAVYVICMLVLIVLLPYASIKLFPRILEKEATPYGGKIPETVEIYITKQDKSVTIPFEEYIQGVVASEMPDSFEEEALKAQAVASRTYALGRINAGTDLCDTVHCQVYRSDNISKKVKDAVNDTKGQVLLYDGNLAAHALFFSSSAGKTENSQDVFSGTFPYLVSVSSSYEPGATHKKETQTMTISQFAEIIRTAFPKLNFGEINSSNIQIKSRSGIGNPDRQSDHIRNRPSQRPRPVFCPHQNFRQQKGNYSDHQRFRSRCGNESVRSQRHGEKGEKLPGDPFPLLSGN